MPACPWMVTITTDPGCGSACSSSVVSASISVDRPAKCRGAGGSCRAGGTPDAAGGSAGGAAWPGHPRCGAGGPGPRCVRTARPAGESGPDGVVDGLGLVAGPAVRPAAACRPAGNSRSPPPAARRGAEPASAGRRSPRRSGARPPTHATRRPACRPDVAAAPAESPARRRRDSPGQLVGEGPGPVTGQPGQRGSVPQRQRLDQGASAAAGSVA